MEEPVHVEHGDNVVSITLNRPARRNALSLPLLGALGEALSEAAAGDAGAVVLAGAGGCFSAGADLAELSGTLEDRAIDDAIETVTDAIRTLPVPVIAAIDGACLGGAFDIAVSCDVRIASADAFFQVPATRLGLLYNPRSIIRMRKRLGRDAVFNLLVLGRRLDADGALEARVVSSVVGEGGSRAAALETAGLAAGNVRGAVAASKALLNAIDGGEFDAGHWETVRDEHLSSPERERAVAEAKARLKDS